VQDRPTAPELLDAVRLFLATELLPAVTDHRLRFRTLVAANLLDMLRRELALEPDLLHAEYARLAALLDDRRREPAGSQALGDAITGQHATLCDLIRAGQAPDACFAAVLDGVRAKLEIANPRYLADFEAV
jgi:hypothetical protein